MSLECFEGEKEAVVKRMERGREGGMERGREGGKEGGKEGVCCNLNHLSL